MNLPNPGRGQTSESEAALAFAPLRAKFIPPLEAEGLSLAYLVRPVEYKPVPLANLSAARL